MDSFYNISFMYWIDIPLTENKGLAILTRMYRIAFELSAL